MPSDSELQIAKFFEYLEGIPKFAKAADEYIERLKDRIKELEAEFAGAPVAGSTERWIPVSERMPEFEGGRWYLVTDGVLIDVAVNLKSRFVGHRDLKVTHWKMVEMPLAGADTDVAKGE